MGTLIKVFLPLLLLGSISACGVEAFPVEAFAGTAVPMQSVGRITNAGNSAVLNTGNASECLNYLKGRTFIGESYRLNFDHEGNVSAYDNDKQLVFEGTLEIGDSVSEMSRWITFRSISDGGGFQFLLSNDGELMESWSLTISRPE